MALPKPLIFIYPISASLQNLKKLMEENSEKEGIEVFECDMIQEAGQLIASVGPSVIFSTDAKKCAQILMANKKFIKENRSKVLLLLKADLPRQTFLKLQKLGLTEIVVEPVPPKSLIFKTQILIKALPAPKGVEEEKKEEEVKAITSLFPTSNEKAVDKNLELKKSHEVNLEFEKPKEEKKKSNTFELDIEEEKKPKKENVELKLESSKPLEKKEDPNSELMDGDEPDEIEMDDDLEDIENYDDEFREKAAKVDLKFEKNKDSSSKKEKGLEIDSSTQKTKEKLDLNIEKKEEVSASKIDLELEKKEKDKAAKNNLELDKKEELLKEAVNLEITKKEIPKKEEQKDLDITHKVKDSSNKNSLNIEKKDKNDKEKLEPLNIEKKEIPKKDSGLEVSKKEKLKDNENLLPEIEKKKIGDHKDDLELNKKPNAPTETSKLDVEKTKKEEAIKNLEIDHGPNRPKSNQSNLELSKKDSDDKPKEESNSGPTSVSSHKDNLELSKKEKKSEEKTELDFEAKAKEETKSSLNVEKKKKEQEELAPLDESEKKIEDVKGLDVEAAKKKNIESSNLEVETKEKNKNQNDDLNIESSGIQHAEYEEKKRKELQREEIKKEAKGKWELDNKDEIEQEWPSLFSADDLAKGEKNNTEEGSSINYAKMFKDFNTKMNSGGLIEDEIKIKADKEVVSEDKDEKGDDIFEPDTKGLEWAINVLNLYEKKKTKENEVFDYISKIIYENLKGMSSFYLIDNEKKTSLNYHLWNNFDLELVETFNNLKTNEIEKWEKTQIPTWSDPTFMNESPTLIFPYFEGLKHIGYSVVYFNQKILETDSHKIEVLMETARGLYLEKLRESGGQGSYNKKSTEKEEPKKGGFFSKLFGKKAS